MNTNWQINHDPLNLYNEEESFDRFAADAIEQDEDILQLENRMNGMVLDLGWYRDKFGIYLVNGDWEETLINERHLKLGDAMKRFHQIAKTNESEPVASEQRLAARQSSTLGE